MVILKSDSTNYKLSFYRAHFCIEEESLTLTLKYLLFKPETTKKASHVKHILTLHLPFVLEIMVVNLCFGPFQTSHHLSLRLLKIQKNKIKLSSLKKKEQ